MFDDFFEEKTNLLDTYKLRIQAEYILDYILWRYILLEKQIDKMEEEEEAFYLESDQNYQLLVFKRDHMIKRMKQHRIYITRGDQTCFDQTGLVDRHQLYQIDKAEYKEFRIEEDRKRGLANNDDLDLESKSATSSPTGKLARSKMGSPGKKPKRAGSKGRGKKSKDASDFLNMTSKTFEGSLRQLGLFELVMKDYAYKTFKLKGRDAKQEA